MVKKEVVPIRTEVCSSIFYALFFFLNAVSLRAKLMLILRKTSIAHWAIKISNRPDVCYFQIQIFLLKCVLGRRLNIYVRKWMRAWNMGFYSLLSGFQIGIDCFLRISIESSCLHIHRYRTNVGPSPFQ